MTDRTDEFRGAVKVFRPTVFPNVADRSESKGFGEAVAPHYHQQQQQPLSVFEDQDDDEGVQLPRFAKPEASDFVTMAASVAVGFEGTAKLVSFLICSREYSTVQYVLIGI